MNNSLDENYWTSRYQQQSTGWDTGSVTTPLKQYLDQNPDLNTYILIPGAGNGHEAAYAHQKGFKNVHVLDFSPAPVQHFKDKYPDFPPAHIHVEDFFKHQGQYDLIIEQTFFCALLPERRKDYALKMHQLLKPGGKLVGVLFNKVFENPGPPFGGNKREYMDYFEGLFKIRVLEPCYNSIPPRQGSELFILLEKPETGAGQ